MADIRSAPSAMARLARCDRGIIHGAVDGAWWPKSPDLSAELPDLAAVFGLWIGPVHRVVYDPSLWLPAPARIIRGTKVISVDPYPLVARDTIYLVGTHSRDALLYVVPPSSAGDTAREILGAVTDWAPPVSVAVLRQLLRQSAALPAQRAEPMA